MTFKVHQALHGYSDGHRQLACSVGLPVKDARLVLVMSDVSGPGIASLGRSYLTGYPLAESGMYALAKTWPAPEMPRPGCVWTHTLLIDFADLAALACPSSIAELFKRPAVNEPLAAYVEDIEVEFQAHLVGQLFSPDALSEYAKLATALYEHPSEQVWARRTDRQISDDVVLQLWDQQWPRLKRSFRFCTLTSRDRSQDGIPFDLQLSPPGESSSQLRFLSTLDGVEATFESERPWLNVLLHDVQCPNASTLRQFLRKLGADMLGGREAMQPFCSLHTALEDPSMQDISEAVQNVESSPLFSDSALAKRVVAQAAITKLPSVDDHVLEFIVNNASALPATTLNEYQGQLAQLLWERAPRSLIALGHETQKEISSFIRAGALSISSASIVRQLSQVIDLAELLLKLIPATAEEPLFWSNSQLSPEIAARAGIDLSKKTVLQAMVLGLREHDSTQSALNAVGSAAILESLQSIISIADNDAQVCHWLRYVCADKNGVAQFFVKASSPSRKLVMLLAKNIEPNAIPNEVGADPWYLVLQTLADKEGGLPLELQVYGFRRALGRCSRSVEDLFKLTFEKLHAAAQSDIIPVELWNSFEYSLPWAPFGQDWDRAIRLRRATARKCNDLQIRAEGLAELVRSDELFMQLLEEIWDLWGGPKYLRSINEALLETNSKLCDRRGRLLKVFMKRRAKFW